MALLPGRAWGADLKASADALLQQLNAGGHFSGAAIIGLHGAVLWEGGVGRADAHLPFTPDTVADGASLAKTVTAAAVWRLVAAGRLAIDDPVQRHLPEFPYAGVSVRQLLSHTAGLPDYDPFAPLAGDGPPPDNLALQGIMRRRSATPLFPPGTAFEYCNICYSTLALLVERVSGRPYADVGVADLLHWAGARSAFLRPVRFADWPGLRTQGYASARADAPLFDSYDNEAIYGESNIMWSARDLHAWASAWAQGAVLPAAVRRGAMAPARIGRQASALTLANWYCRRSACHYTGHHQGFFSFVWWDAASRQTAVFISNSALPPPLHPWLFRALIALGSGQPVPRMPAFLPAEREVDMAAVSGRYDVAGVGRVTLGQEGDRLFVARGPGPRYTMFQVGHGTLYVPGLDAYLSFAPNGTLRWESLLGSGQGRRMGPRP